MSPYSGSSSTYYQHTKKKEQSGGEKPMINKIKPGRLCGSLLLLFVILIAATSCKVRDWKHTIGVEYKIEIPPKN